MFPTSQEETWVC